MCPVLVSKRSDIAILPHAAKPDHVNLEFEQAMRAASLTCHHVLHVVTTSLERVDVCSCDL